VLTLYIRHFSLFTRRFWPNHWAPLDLPRVLNFSLVMRSSSHASRTTPHFSPTTLVGSAMWGRDK
jgi:hypothetical protein